MALFPVAQAVPFNNATDGYTAIQVQAAIEEAGTGAHIVDSSVSSQTTTTTTSATLATLNSMTLTPPEGKYRFDFNMTVQTTTGGNSITVVIQLAGTSIAASSRTIQFPTATLIDSGYPFSLSTLAYDVTVNGSQAVTVAWSTTGGTATALNRTLGYVMC